MQMDQFAYTFKILLRIVKVACRSGGEYHEVLIVVLINNWYLMLKKLPVRVGLIACGCSFGMDHCLGSLLGEVDGTIFLYVIEF